MLNIEIHGCDSNIGRMMRKQIFNELFAGKSYLNEIFVTVAPSEVASKASFREPFIRLYSSDDGKAATALEILSMKLPGMNIEYVKLERFIPRKA